MNSPEPVDRIWLKSYPKGVPAQVDTGAYASLREVLETSCERYRDQPAYTNLGKTLDYAAVDRLSRDFAAFLQGELGLAKGDRLAVMLPNLLQYAIAVLGALRAGVVVVNVNPLYTPRELTHQLRDSGARAIVVLELFTATVAKAMAGTDLRHVVTTGVGDLLGAPRAYLVNLATRYLKGRGRRARIPGAIPLRRALAAGRRRPLETVPLGPDDLAFLQYTGGTTGVPKGAMLSHGNMVANLMQVQAWARPFVRPGEELVVTALPLYHIFSLTANCFTFLLFGGHNLLVTDPRARKAFVKLLSRTPFTILTGVNTLFHALLETAGFERLDFSRLHVVLGGGMAVQKAVAERWKAVTGTTLVEAYGLTETCPGVCINPLDLPEHNGTVGLPLPNTEVCVCDDAGHPLGTDQVGELWVRGPQVTRGYWQRPDETAAAITPEGWLHTGDLASMDERGYVRIVDRKKDMIVVSGFNVYPNEVEEVAAMHPGVSEAAAVGVPDPRSGEAVKLLVVPADPELTPADLIAHCRAHLARYKVPRHVELRDSLPKSNVGKILRRALREEQRN
jgi:long-chain acyl-CoA synthetase